MHWMQSNLTLADDARGLSSDGEFCYRRTYLNELSPFWVPLSVRLVRLPWLTTPSVGIEELKHRRQGKRIVLVSDRGVERHNAEASVLGQQTVCCPDTVFARAASATHGSGFGALYRLHSRASPSGFAIVAHGMASACSDVTKGLA